MQVNYNIYIYIQVGGFNPFEKYSSNWGDNNKYLKPPPSIQYFTPTSSNFTLRTFPFLQFIPNQTSLWVPTKPIRSWSLVRWSCNPGNPKIWRIWQRFFSVNVPIDLSCWRSKTLLLMFPKLMVPAYKEILPQECVHQHVAETTMVSKVAATCRKLEVRELCLNRNTREKPISS